MIAVDASAILAILLNEPDASRFEAALMASRGGLISPVNYWEVMARATAARGAQGRGLAEALLTRLGVDVAAMGVQEARIAADAFEAFGKRTQARLNLGDCFAYALAAREGDGLLFKGEDFPRTDVKSALA